jgi:hypothetical protein
LRIAVIFLLTALSLFGSSGKITEATGPTQITRDKDKIEGKANVGIEMFDTIETLRSRVDISFVDDTRVQITEFSKLKIDEFVYDPSSGKGSLSIKAASGTIRYTSGLIAKNSKENVKIKTPTAVVSVRGTDFSMSVGEDGKSLIVLLPSLPALTGSSPVVGSIEVTNASGTVVLNQAYQATFVSSAFSNPTSPVILDLIDESKINNNLLVESSKSITKNSKETKKVSSEKDKVEDKKEDKSNKKTGDTKTQVAQQTAAESVTEAASTTTDAPPPPKQEIEVAQIKLDAKVEAPTVEAPKVEAPATVTNIAAVQEVPKVIIPSITNPIQTNNITSGTTTVNNGFTTDGKYASLYLSTDKGVIRFTTKYDANSTVTVNGQAYVLNYGEKSKVYITQR